ncbi:50S ribosomal protein L11 methyltransferase [Lentiprolixibacter aurantiacus]|uniref:Ribosomal protein L11 methyltransferase n=1 Tax=Lentiprolixibacter aurantiacus TaxID=2993939 RepID=A0AAE3MNI5_9FLAO|nr:50S ribosomal protein L11 methyltransferase [Lentiprolixibacter aurantiacus]MCX2720561.1 50S ribosomal protein L11 methyltransferase [Lentiprolixibacter aurantiacus]
MAVPYLEYNFQISPQQPATDILIAELAELGFDSFVETETGLQAYIPYEGEVPDLSGVGILSNPEFEISHNRKEVEPINWNETWEKNFHPILIEEHCAIRAPFHQPFEVPYEIVIEPKMSFGTGHHETTHMMLQYVLKAELEGKSVLDMGCGTGVLAILAGMRGAQSVTAIDIDNWSYENSMENVKRNGQPDIEVIQGDASLLAGRKFDIILANINRNILLEDLPTYREALIAPGGELYLSGFYEEDLPLLTDKCNSLGLRFSEKLKKGDWVSAKYVF